MTSSMHDLQHTTKPVDEVTLTRYSEHTSEAGATHARTLNMVTNCFLSSASITHGLAVPSTEAAAGEGVVDS